MIKYIFHTRLIHWKKQWISITCWLLLPIIGTIFIFQLTNLVREDVKIPIGIVVEDQSTITSDLVEDLAKTNLIRAEYLPYKEALHRLTKHELDSVFVFQKGFAEKVEKHDRHQLITSYYTDLSFAYPTVKEIVISHVQQTTGRSKAAFTVQSLAKQYEYDKDLTWKEIVTESTLIQQEQDLLQSSFSFYKKDVERIDHDQTLVNVWGIWAIFTLLATMFLFDWPGKETHSYAKFRFPFTRLGFKPYLLFNLLIYIVLFFVIDVLTMIVFYFTVDKKVTIMHIVFITAYRLIIAFSAFLLSNCFKRVYSYYLVALITTLFVSVTSGVILPLDGVMRHFKVLTWINPMHDLIESRINPLLLIIISSIIIVWFLRKERQYATS